MLAFAIGVVMCGNVLRAAAAAVVERVPAGAPFDIVLSSVPFVGSSIVYVYVQFLAASTIFFIITKFYYKPVDLPYMIFMFAAGMVLNAIMFSVTIFGAPDVLYNAPVAWACTKDLFPSWHVGTPIVGFLLADRRWVKAIMLAVTVIMCITVLLMRVHYTIDVIGAIFVFYGMVMLGEKYMKKRLRRSY